MSRVVHRAAERASVRRSAFIVCSARGGKWPCSGTGLAQYGGSGVAASRPLNIMCGYYAKLAARFPALLRREVWLVSHNTHYVVRPRVQHRMGPPSLAASSFSVVFSQRPGSCRPAASAEVLHARPAASGCGGSQSFLLARSRLASFRCPPRPVQVMQTRVFPQPSVPQSALQRLRASPARARQTVRRVTDKL